MIVKQKTIDAITDKITIGLNAIFNSLDVVTKGVTPRGYKLKAGFTRKLVALSEFEAEKTKLTKQRLTKAEKRYSFFIDNPLRSNIDLGLAFARVALNVGGPYNDSGLYKDESTGETYANARYASLQESNIGTLTPKALRDKLDQIAIDAWNISPDRSAARSMLKASAFR